MWLIHHAQQTMQCTTLGRGTNGTREHWDPNWRRARTVLETRLDFIDQHSTTCCFVFSPATDVMVHTPNLTSISMQYRIQKLLAAVEYYDQVDDEWLVTYNFTSNLTHLTHSPIQIVMDVGHPGTYFRSRIDMVTWDIYTISLAYTGTPPPGETPSGCTVEHELATHIKSRKPPRVCNCLHNLHSAVNFISRGRVQKGSSARWQQEN